MPTRPRSEPLPYYRWYWRDWRASRAVQRMPFEARAIYRELLDECWVSGTIPDLTSHDTALQLADIVGTSHDIITTWWSHVRPQFRKKGRRLYNDRIERERTIADQLRVEKSLAGKKSAEVRRAKASTGVEQPLTGVQHSATSSSSAVQEQSISSSSAARSTRVRGTRRAGAALGGETPRATASKLTRIDEADWRSGFTAAGVQPPKRVVP